MNRRTFCAAGTAAVATLRLPDEPRAALARRPRPIGRRRPGLGLHLDGVPQHGLDRLADAETAVGRVQIVSWYQAIGGPGTWAHPDWGWLDQVTASGRTGLLTLEPWAYRHPDPAWSCDSIAGGAHDTILTEWAEAFAIRHDGPWYLRPMHEMNGTWYPWAGSDPYAYQAAWKRIVDLFDHAGADRVRWVWCPLVDDVGPHELEAYWPGSRYVDVIGLDGYNWGTNHPENGGWRTTEQVFSTAYDRVHALNRGLPVWLCEVGCAPAGGDKPAWVTDLYHLVYTQLRAVEAVVWFSLDKEQNWEVHTDPAVAAAIRNRRP